MKALTNHRSGKGGAAFIRKDIARQVSNRHVLATVKLTEETNPSSPHPALSIGKRKDMTIRNNVVRIRNKLRKTRQINNI